MSRSTNLFNILKQSQIWHNGRAVTIRRLRSTALPTGTSAAIISGGTVCLFCQTHYLHQDAFKGARGSDSLRTSTSKRGQEVEDESITMFEDDDSSAWASFSDKFALVGNSIASVEWPTIPDKIRDFIIPDWVRPLPVFIAKLQAEISSAPGSLSDEIWNEASDPHINPEILQDASVRISTDLCNEEKSFLKERKAQTRAALARYLDLKESDVHPDDVPVIAMCGSGGGLRALVAGTSSYLCAQEAGLFDCVTYTAGVSGSCWLQTLYYSSIGKQRHDRIVEHLKSRIGVHIAFPPKALSLLSSAPTNKFLLSGIVEKLKGDPDCNFGLVDIYGLLLAGRLLIPKGELGVEDINLKLSNQRRFVDSGAYPLPIYTSVRHEIPIEEVASDPKTTKENVKATKEAVKEKAKREAWFQWFESTPYELWCEELHCGIPTWAVGRKFSAGQNVPNSSGHNNPEYRVPLLMGVWGSAFCATLAHYYKEVRPVVRGLAGFAGIDSLLEERNEELGKVHPIDPASIPNFALGLKDKLPKSAPASVFKQDHLQLMDAGMSNNLPIYPLLRPGRDVDVIVAFDASADVKQENWLSFVDGYARRRGIKGWPVHAGWPKEGADAKDTAVELAEAQEVRSVQEATHKVVEAREQHRQESAGPEAPSSEKDKAEKKENSTDLGYCTVWVGSKAEERASASRPGPPSSSQEEVLEDDKGESKLSLMKPDAGIAVVYFPLLPNEGAVPGVRPDETDFLSTWNFIYTPEEIEKVVALARANFREGEEKTKRTVRAVYERKKMLREEREGKEKAERRRRKLRLGIVGRKGEGDLFS